MAKILALYKTPKDPAAFDSYYAATHAPLARTLPGLKQFKVSKGAVNGPSDYHMIAVLDFESLASLQAALASPEGQATVGDIGNFADGGCDDLLVGHRLIRLTRRFWHVADLLELRMGSSSGRIITQRRPPGSAPAAPAVR